MGDSDQTPPSDEIDRLRGVLDKTNTDFEEFVSMAAHNLRQDLRDVVTFSQLMNETYAARLDSEAVAFLDKIQQGSERMQSLLADVVDYWATGTGEPQPLPTEMEDVLRQALLLADQQIATRGATVTHDPLPAVYGSFEVLTKVLHHLIKNAIEYCEAPSPHVHISSKRAGTDQMISVQDNGPGIEPPFHTRIFTAFRRLHGRDYPGNGLGLAFCKKSIEENGGRIWVESEKGAGSTFHFTLPAID
jgi:light-regulated signal transduction histidine kinase (bacteriophytochrome)